MIPASEAARRRARGAAALAEGNRDGLPELRVAVAGTFNLDLWPPFLVEALERAGLYAHVALAPFGQLAQELPSRPRRPTRSSSSRPRTTSSAASSSGSSRRRSSGARRRRSSSARS